MTDQQDDQAATSGISKVLVAVVMERRRQYQLWGDQRLPDGTGPDDRPLPRMSMTAREAADWARARCQWRNDNKTLAWSDIALEEFAEALAEDDPAKLRTELVQLGAVVTAWIQDIDRRAAGR